MSFLDGHVTVTATGGLNLQISLNSPQFEFRADASIQFAVNAIGFSKTLGLRGAAQYHVGDSKPWKAEVTAYIIVDMCSGEALAGCDGPMCRTRREEKPPAYLRRRDVESGAISIPDETNSEAMGRKRREEKSRALLSRRDDESGALS